MERKRERNEKVETEERRGGKRGCSFGNMLLLSVIDQKLHYPEVLEAS